MSGQSKYLAGLPETPGRPLTADHITSGANAGDPECLRLLNQAARRLGQAISGCVNFFNPSLVVFGGGVSRAGDLLLPGIRKAVLELSLPLATRNLRIDITRLDDTAGTIGAAFAVIDQLLRADRFSWWAERSRGHLRCTAVQLLTILYIILYPKIMKFRYLGRSGIQISALTFGNWLTRHSRSDVEAASRCIRAALDAGITCFDSADSYANGMAEESLGAALAGERRESLTVMTKVFFPVGPEPWGKNDCGLSRKHIMEGIDGSLRRLRMDYVDVYHAHRFDRFTPLEETMQAFADIVRHGKALYIGVSEWTPEALLEGQALARQLGFSLISNQAQYSMLWRVIESEVIPASEELGISQP